MILRLGGSVDSEGKRQGLREGGGEGAEGEEMSIGWQVEGAKRALDCGDGS